jgi:cytochrome c oxidase cbb3-type subunit 3
LFSVFFSAKGDEEQKALVWDENLREGSNAPPMWWFWLIFSALVFSVIYLILYPGLGAYSGVLRWSQAGHMHGSRALYDETFGNLRAEIAATSIDAVQDDAMAMESAERVFNNNCAACHGGDAEGQAQLFPNLTDADWQWGGAPEQIEQTIRNGRRAAMPAHGAIVGEEGVERAVDYVLALSNGEAVAEDDPGRMLFGTYCFACHGEDGTGNPLLGAPNLTDGTWLYGGGREALTETIANGRNGVMPAFAARLDDTQIRLLVAWLRENAGE